MNSNYSKFHLVLIYLIFFLFVTNEDVNAKKITQAPNCGCTLTLPTNPDGAIYFNGSGVKPGSKVCIAAGTYKCINLSNFNGTAAAPIQFINCGGQVNINWVKFMVFQ